MKKYVGRFFSIFLLALIVIFTLVEGGMDRKPVTKVKSEIAGTRLIHQLIKTWTGQEEIAYDEHYASREFLKATAGWKSAQARRSNDIPWVERGPGNIGGRARAILVDDNDPTGDSWFIGTAGGGIWKTEDAGEAWRNVSPFFPNLSIVTLAQSQTNPMVIYAGSGEGGLGGNFVNGIGIFKSIDGGETWRLLPATTSIVSDDFQNTNRIVVHPDDENLVYAATSNGIRQGFAAAIMRSQDGGNSWERVYSPPGRAQQILFDPDTAATLYASLSIAGFARSRDAGESWEITELSEVVTNSGGDPERTELAVAPSSTNIIYASVSYRNRTGSGLYRSDDKGTTWVEVKDPEEPDTDFLVQGEYDNCIIVDPRDHDNVFFGGVRLFGAQLTGGVDSTAARDFIGVEEVGTTGFLSFTRFSGGTHFNGTLDIEKPALTPTIELRFGGLSQKAHRFTVPVGANAGVSNADYEYNEYVDVPFEVWDIDANQQLMVSFRDQQRDGVFNLNEGALDDDESTNREYIFVHSIPYDTLPSDTVVVNGGHTIGQYIFIWPTLTGGATWDPQALPTSTLRINFGRREFLTAAIGSLEGNRDVHPDHHALAYSTDNRLITVTDGGLAVTVDDGESFEERESGMVTSQYYSVDRHPNRGVYIGGTQDNDVNLSLTENPTSSSAYDDNVFRDFFADGFDVSWNADGERILGSNQHNYIFRSDNQGRDWEESTSGLDDSDIFGENDNTPFFTKLAYSKFGPDRVFAVSDRGVWRSEDFGENWELQRISSGFGGFLDVEVSDVDVDIVWAGGALDQGRRVFVSTDGGLSFDPVNFFEDLPSKGNITTIETDPIEAQTAYLLFSQPGEPKVLKTTDLGVTWEDISGFENGVSTSGFPDVGVFSLLVFPEGDRIWVGTEIGIFETLNGGLNWRILESEMPAVAIWDLRVVEGEVLAGTHGRGIWTADMGLIYENIRLQRPLDVASESISLSVFPNPTNGGFRIQGLDGAERVEVWTVSGHLIASFSDDIRPERVYEIKESKGLHFVRVLRGESIWTTKLLVQ